MSSDFIDEVSAINSIYDPDTITLTSSGNPSTAILKFPLHPQFTFLLSFPGTYPASAPLQVKGTHSTGDSAKGDGEAAVKVLQEVLERVWAPGQVCLFDLIEEANQLLPRSGKGEDETEHGVTASGDGSWERGEVRRLDSSKAANAELLHHEQHHHDLTSSGGLDAISPPNWSISTSVTEKKSTFMARCAPVTSRSQASEYISHLIATNKKVAAATHNITAFRIRDSTNPAVVVQDCDDDGETAAGGRVLHLMQLMDVWGVVVVVTRWYGGVLLGSDRFRIINAVARDALVSGGFAKEKEKESDGKKKGKK